MKKLMFVLALCLFITSYSMAGPGDEITGVAVDDFSTQYNTNTAPLGTINEDGFIPANYTHNATFNDFWVSANAIVADQDVTYDLGAEYEIGKIDIWNYNGGSLDRCVKDVNVAVSTNGVDFTVVKSITVPPGVSTGEEPVHTFYVSPKVTARYVMIDVQTGYGGASNFVGFAEIKFFEYVPGEITGVAIDDHSTNFGTTPPINTINESGFDSGTYTHNGTFTDFWCSANATVAAQYVTYDLGASYDVGKIDIWNYNGGSLTRCVKDIDIYVSTAAAPTTWISVDTLTIPQGVASGAEPVHNYFVSPAASTIQYLKVDVQTGYGGLTNYVGFAEIKFFEYSDNASPIVSAGAHQEVILPADAVMDATVSDVDGDPLTLLWTKVSGPGTVSFDDDSIEDPTVTFSAAGYYQLQLSANDGVNPAVTNSLYVRVMPAGWSYIDGVEAIERSAAVAGRDMENTVDESGLNAGVLGSHSTLLGDTWHSTGATDDQYVIWDLGGLYDLDGLRVWTFNAAPYTNRGVKDCDMLVSTDDSTYTGIGAFSFAQAPGTTDTDYSEVSMVTPVFCRYIKMDVNTNWGFGTTDAGLSEIKFSGTLANVAPIVDAGEGAEVIYPADADITDAAASDPDADAITYLWTKVDGPGAVAFDDDTVIDPTVTFGAAGAYVLQLAVTDIYNQTTTDTIPVRVLPSWWRTVDGVTAEDASTEFGTRVLVKTVDESGLNENGMGTHDRDYNDEWHSAFSIVADDQYAVWDLGDDYLVNGLRVWNSVYSKYDGIEDVNILISLDGTNFTDLGEVTFAMGTQSETIDESEVIALDTGGSLARYIKFNVNSTHDTVDDHVVLAEIKFSGYLNGCTEAMAGDLNDDCVVDTDDLGMMAGQWLNCMDPAGDCDEPWTSGCYADRQVDFIDIPTTMVDGDTSFRTLTQCHNQKMVSNDNGIFMTYIRDYPNYKWRLMQSTDGGSSFSLLYEQTVGSVRPPTIETDSSNNVYLIDRNTTSGAATFYRFEPADYTTPAVTTTFASYGPSGKHGMAMDESGEEIYYMVAYGGMLQVLDLNGVWLRSHTIESNTSPDLTYPHLLFDNGVLHLAYIAGDAYDAIFYMRSDDGGVSWETMDGTSITIPMTYGNIADCPADEITDVAERTDMTFLANYIVKDSKIHFMYQNKGDDIWTDTWQMRYKRFDSGTGVADIDRTGLSDGEVTINGSDGLFVTDFGDAGSPLFMIGREENYMYDYDLGRIKTLVSCDNGSTWSAYAMSDVPFEFHRLYSLGGCKQLSSDGHIIGAFTNILEDRGGNSDQLAETVFYKIPTGAPQNCQQTRDLGYWLDADACPDCKVDLKDFAAMAADWLEDTFYTP